MAAWMSPRIISEFVTESENNGLTTKTLADTITVATQSMAIAILLAWASKTAVDATRNQ